MDKITYLAKLAEGLARWVPERERQDILRYYAEYFEEAGPGREAEVVAELGDPWALSCRLAVEGGFVTQENADAWTPRRNKRKIWPWVALGSVAALAIVGISVASFASTVGRFVGRTVGNAVGGTDDPLLGVVVTDSWAVAESVPDVYQYEYGPVLPGDSGVAFIEGEAVSGEGIWSMEDGCLEAFRAVDVDISMGNIIITGGEDYTLVIQRSGNLGGYELKWEVQGDTLKIQDGSSGGHNIGFGELGNVLGKKALDVIITVPEGEVLQKVTAKTEFGNVYLADLDVEVKVTGKTDMGNVDGCDIRTAQKVELKTDMGNVTFGLGDPYTGNGMDIDLETDMGNVEAQMECYENECAYELETDMGKVSINGVSQGTKAERKGVSSVKLDAESSMGNVDVYFLDDRWQ